MTGAQAFGRLHHIRGTIVTATIELIWPTSYRFRTMHLGVTAREDSLDRIKRETLARLNRNRNSNSQVRWGREMNRFTRAYNVRSYGINSDFDDPFPVLEELSEPGIDEEARSYKVRQLGRCSPPAKWKIRAREK